MKCYREALQKKSVIIQLKWCQARLICSLLPILQAQVKKCGPEQRTTSGSDSGRSDGYHNRL